MKLWNRALFLSLWIAVGPAARADTLVLKDGSFVEGKIIRENRRRVTVETRFGLRTYPAKNVVRTIKTKEEKQLPPVGPDQPFDQYPPAFKAALNAQAEYDLGNYDEALKRLEPYREYTENEAIRRRIDWLIINLQERRGRWDETKRLLEDKRLHGTPAEQIRAKAHLAIFKANPAYDLRYVGDKPARHFLKDETLRNLAREPNALKDHHLMRLALEEYCEQLLVEDRFSVKAFADQLDVDVTYEACKTLPRAGDIGRHMPYMDRLKKAEGTLVKAQAVLGEYGSAFELDLVRTELNHLAQVINRFLVDLQKVDPFDFVPAFDARTGNLTPQGRAQWQQRCDAFLTLARPLQSLLKYMANRVAHYPNALFDLKRIYQIRREQLDQAVKSVKKARNRIHV